jgi:hypothetical protein
MSGSRVRENRMHGLTGGRWRSDSHGEPDQCTRRETNGTEPDHLPLADQPAAYLTRSTRRAASSCAGPWIGRRRSRPRRGLRAVVAYRMRESGSRVDRSECSGGRHKPDAVDPHSSAPGTAHDESAGLEGRPDVRGNVLVAYEAASISAVGRHADVRPLCLKATPVELAPLEQSRE